MASNKNTPIIIAVSLVVLIVVVGSVSVLYLTNFLKYDRYDKQDFIDSNTYQAVFLTNEQIYFGRLKNINSDYLILSDVYYVKVDTEGVGKVVKLGTSEPYGPLDKMIINQDQVLYWENLSFDSPFIKRVQGI